MRACLWPMLYVSHVDREEGMIDCAQLNLHERRGETRRNLEETCWSLMAMRAARP